MSQYLGKISIEKYMVAEFIFCHCENTLAKFAERGNLSLNPVLGFIV
jgi:hypothetical protein